MGESGSGKSTLVKIILGFLEPINGKIILNNKKLDSDIIDWWHSIVAYIPQKVFILDEDIYENISLKKNITDQNKKEIEELLKNLNLLDLISSNNNQDKKVLGGEEGKKYSGGQIQRIAIARALFQKRKFLILDETLNALDDDNIANVLDFLNKIPEVTILLIAHSNNVAKKCQKIINLENKKTNEIRIS
jgi:ABC-type bacteriocin/lantibiotic exporter with double-glycine peptidase domain